MWFSFDADGQIVAYDASFRWFAWLFDEILQAFGKNQGFGSDAGAAGRALKLGLIQQICGTASLHCIGPDVQYHDSTDCTDFLTREIRLGGSYEFAMNTILCRNLHQLMVAFRPHVHCPHIGPTGGDMCVDNLEYSLVAATNIVNSRRISTKN